MLKGNVLEIDKIIYRLSKEITESEFNNPLLLGIPRRGDLIAKRISKNLDQLNYAHDIDTVDYLPFRDDLEEEIKKTKLNIIGKNIPTNEEEYVSVFLKELDDVDKVEVK